MNRRPEVTLTFAQSLDGRIATRAGLSRWISGSETLELAHQLRNDHDAILVGVGTVVADNPQLTCRMPGGRSPVRVILDSNLRTPVSAEIVQSANQTPTLLFTSRRNSPEESAPFTDAGVTVIRIGETATGRLDLSELFGELVDRGIRSLLIEGGSQVITSIVAADAWDRLIIVMAPMIIGDGTSSVGDLGTVSLADAPRAKSVRVYQAGNDIVWEMERLDGK